MTTQWASIGEGLYDPVAVSPSPGQAVVLARNAAGEIGYAVHDDEGWQPWQYLGRPGVEEEDAPLDIPVDWPLAACSSAPGRIDLLARSPEGELLHAGGSVEELTAFACLGAPASFEGGLAVPMGIAGPPAVCSRQHGHLDVFAVGLHGDLLYTRFDGASWHPFESLGLPVLSEKGTSGVVPVSAPLAACAMGESHLGVFFRGAGGDLVIKWWEGAAWSAYASLGTPRVQNEMYPAVTVPSPLAGAPAACSRKAGRLDVFARGAKGDLVRTWWDGRAWQGFESLWMPVSEGPEPAALPLTGAVTACAPSPDLIHVFGRALDGRLYHLALRVPDGA